MDQSGANEVEFQVLDNFSLHDVALWWRLRFSPSQRKKKPIYSEASRTKTGRPGAPEAIWGTF